ncbi:ribonucleotide reductase subunit alpha [Eggerthellaceae bacterium zg-893]|nr:ribonucleotide reductase subunit alpha [Eggerthellaceae bacterium zg-893]
MTSKQDAQPSPAGPSSRFNDLAQAADAARTDGDDALALHLYMAAFEQSSREDRPVPVADVVAVLDKAWDLVCSLRERSLAEHVFEQLEPFLDTDSIASHLSQLQELTLDRLEEYGLTRESLEHMANMVGEDVFGGEMPAIAHVESLPLPFGEMQAFVIADDASAQPTSRSANGAGDGSPARSKPAEAKAAPSASQAISRRASEPPAAMPAASKAAAGRAEEAFTYHDLVGYDSVVALMRDFGVGMQKDAGFQEFVGMLNAKYGLDRMPASDTMLFRSPVREDACRFMMATVGELGLPCVRMRMEENVQGMPVLCVTAQADSKQRNNFMRNGFDGPGVLVLEDLDAWVSPLSEPSPEDLGGFLMVGLSRGAREAVNVIRGAVENPDVFVLACASSACEVDPFFYEMLEPLTVIDIDYPTDEERAAIWDEVVRVHPSLSTIDRDQLVKYSASMARYDMYMAAHDAIEDAYKTSLAMRRYVPVTAENMFDKLAAYQPLDSKEYQALEDAVVADFQRGLDSLEDYVNGKEGRE